MVLSVDAKVTVKNGVNIIKLLDTPLSITILIQFYKSASFASKYLTNIVQQLKLQSKCNVR